VVLIGKIRASILFEITGVINLIELL